jgi:hypothetical protein
MTHASFPTSPSSNPADVIARASLTGAGIAGEASKYTFPTDLPKVHLNLIEADWVQGLGRTLQSRRLYRLPLPLQMPETTNVQFNNNFSYLESLGQGANNLFPVAGAVADLVAPIAGAVAGGTGFTVADLKGVTMESPQFKTHTFSWKLAPKSASESANIMRIITGIKIGMLPSYVRPVLQFPKIYVPYFYPNANWLFKFKPCVIQSLTIDFNGGNPQPGFYHVNQAPEGITMSMQLLEMEYWTSQDVERGTTDGLPDNDPHSAWTAYSLDNGSTGT